MKQTYRMVLAWALFILAFAAFFSFMSPGRPEPAQLPFSELMARIDKKDVSELRIQADQNSANYEGLFSDGSAFKAIGPEATVELEKEIRGKVKKVEFRRADQGNGTVQVILSFLPLALVIVLIVFFMRQMQAGGGKAMSFGKSKAKLLSESHNKVTFADVAGIDEAKDELEEIIAFLKDPRRFTRLGGRIPKGVLLMGPPGTGKTLIAKAVAGEAGVPFFSISGSDFVEMFVGVGASRVRDLFEQGKKNAPCIIFIDEIDAVGRHRGAGLGGGHDEREQTLNQLLVEMDGFESNEGVIIIAATNRDDVLDPALLRPGRFDRRIVVPRPDVRGREGILRVHTKKTPLAPEVDLNAIARGTSGFSGADLQNLVNEAALVAARRNKDHIDNVDFEFAKDKVLMGAERKSMVVSDQERKNTAIHESGHTIVGYVLPGCDPVHKVTIIPRGRALGVTQSLPKQDILAIDFVGARDRIAMMMGGRIAEEIFQIGLNSGAKNDIEKATGLARAMVTEWGMSETLGPVAYAQPDGDPFLGRAMANGAKDYSEATAIEIDKEVRRIVTEQYSRAREILEDRRELLQRMADALFEYETLDAADIKVLMEGGTIVREKPAPRAAPVAAPRPEKRPERKNILETLENLGKPPAEPSKA